MAQAQQETAAEREAREDATAAVIKLQSVIEMVRTEMTEQQDAYTKCAWLDPSEPCAVIV